MAGFVYVKTLPQSGNAANIPDTLQYTLHEEGRIRWSYTQATPSGGFVYDYFLKDHEGNVRSTLTDEKRTDDYPAASLEAAALATEKSYYTNLDGGRTDRTYVANYPTNDTYTNPNTWVQKLNGNGTKAGAGILLKVMAGDSLTVHASSWYAGGSPTPGTPVSPLTDLVTALANSVPGAAGGKMISSQLGTTVLSPSITGFLSSRDAGNVSTQPKSYLNIVVLDEQLNPVITSDGKNSYFEQVGTGGGSSVKQYNILKRPITKSGYVYVYVSNETPNIDVYWDNLKVTQTRGKLAAEEGYYPFGLGMSALSSHAGAVANNAYKYNSGTELMEDLDVDYYETYLRQYDAQIGRFTGVDVLSEATFSFSPYHYGANDPVFFNDPSGAVFVKPGPPPDIVRMGTGHSPLGIAGNAGALSGYNGIDIGYASPGGTSDDSGSGMDFGWMFSYTGIGMGYGGSSGGDCGGPRSGGGGGGSGSSNPRITNNEGREGTDTRRTWRESNRDRWTNLSMFDERGRELLGRWLNGRGTPLVVKNGVWGEYMKQNELLKEQILEKLQDDAIQRVNTGVLSYINLTFHAVIENGYSTGYEMLHGSNPAVGDFHLGGYVNVLEGKVVYNLTLTWNDIIDPNPKYDLDTESSDWLKYLYSPKDYTVQISWNQIFQVLMTP